MEEARERMARREEMFRLLSGEQMEAEDFRAEMASLAEQEKGDDYSVEIFEPIIASLSGNNIITRNRYGAEVLNSTEICFVDIDRFPAGLWEKLLSLLGGGKRSEEQRLLAELQRLHREDPTLSMRLYRSAGGWRLILSGEGLAPDSPRMQELFTRLNADPAYAKLCKKQQCWRARLTPKPGRLSLRPGRYPRRCAADTPAEGEADWLARYAEGCEGWAVCRLVERFGEEMRHPLIELHDERTHALKDGLRLA